MKLYIEKIVSPYLNWSSHVNERIKHIETHVTCDAQSRGKYSRESFTVIVHRTIISALE